MAVAVGRVQIKTRNISLSTSWVVEVEVKPRLTVGLSVSLAFLGLTSKSAACVEIYSVCLREVSSLTRELSKRLVADGVYYAFPATYTH
jgi:hypothetical protein